MNPVLDTNEWTADPQGKAEDHWLPLVCEEAAEGQHWWSAVVKWDGCVDLRRYHNVPYGTPDRDKDHLALDDYIHICDLDDLISKLQKLKEAAIKHYGADWPR